MFIGITLALGLVASVSAQAASPEQQFSRAVVKCIMNTDTIGKGEEEVFGACYQQAAKSAFFGCLLGLEDTIGRSEEEVFGQCRQTVSATIVSLCTISKRRMGRSTEADLAECQTRAFNATDRLGRLGR